MSAFFATRLGDFGLSRISVFQKIAAMIALGTALVAIALTVMSARQANGLAVEKIRSFAQATSENLTSRAIGAVRFNDSVQLRNLIDEMTAMADGALSKVVVTAADGTVIAGFGDQTGDLVRLANGANAPMMEQVTDSLTVFSAPIIVPSNGARIGGIATEWSADQALANVDAAEHVIWGTAAALFVLSLALIGLLIRRTIIRPLDDVAASLHRVADGDYATRVSGTERGDEIGVFARHIADLQDRLRMAQAEQASRALEQEDQRKVVAALSTGLRALSNRDLTFSLDQSFSGEYESLRADFNASVETLRDALHRVVEVSSGIRQGADEIATASDNLARRTETQAATLEETAAALEEITSSVATSASNAKEVDRIVRDAQQDARSSDQVVRAAVEAMSMIENSSSQISQIITVIDDIAFQTNLLALNAGVEAARAGEAGRGFAVVATEVRSLAQRSSDAAKEIKELITGSAEQVEQGVDLVHRAGEALSQISERITHISSLMSGIATAADEQAKGVTEINVGVSHLDQVTQQNAAMVEEATAASHVLRQQSLDLGDLLAQFRTGAPTASATPVFRSAVPRKAEPVPDAALPHKAEPTSEAPLPRQADATGWDWEAA